MITLGIDPGTATTGYGIVKDSRDGRLYDICHGVIRTDSKTPYPLRLKAIHDELTALIEQHKPQAIAIEELFFNKNVKSAMLVGQAKGVILLAAQHQNIPVYEFTPLQIKMAVVGYGRASKEQIQQMVKTLLSLSSIPKPDHAADALAAALCCSQSLFNIQNYK